MTRSKRADIFTPEKRSAIMRAVKGANTKPEIALRKALFALGFRYRLHGAKLPGKPDIVFPARHAVIFVNGCFWHGHQCSRGSRRPKTNARYWRDKIRRNCERDAETLAALEKLGWRVRVVFECDLKDIDRAAANAAMWLTPSRVDCCSSRLGTGKRPQRSEDLLTCMGSSPYRSARE